MARRRLQLHPTTQIFLVLLGITVVVWVLRGLTLLAFLPGWVLWLLLLVCIGSGIVSSLQKMR